MRTLGFLRTGSLCLAALWLASLGACGGAAKPAAEQPQNATGEAPSIPPEDALLAKLETLAFAVNVDCPRLPAGVDQWIAESGQGYGELAAQIAGVERPADDADQLEEKIMQRLEGIIDRIDACGDTEGVEGAFERLAKVLGR